MKSSIKRQVLILIINQWLKGAQSVSIFFVLQVLRMFHYCRFIECSFEVQFIEWNRSTRKTCYILTLTCLIIMQVLINVQVGKNLENQYQYVYLSVLCTAYLIISEKVIRSAARSLGRLEYVSTSIECSRKTSFLQGSLKESSLLKAERYRKGSVTSVVEF